MQPLDAGLIANTLMEGTSGMNWAVIWRCLKTLHCVAPQIADAEGVLTHFRIIMRHAPARAQDPPYDTVWQPLQGLLVSSASAAAFLR